MADDIFSTIDFSKIITTLIKTKIFHQIQKISDSMTHFLTKDIENKIDIFSIMQPLKL